MFSVAYIYWLCASSSSFCRLPDLLVSNNCLFLRPCWFLYDNCLCIRPRLSSIIIVSTFVHACSSIIIVSAFVHACSSIIIVSSLVLVRHLSFLLRSFTSCLLRWSPDSSCSSVFVLLWLCLVIVEPVA